MSTAADKSTLTRFYDALTGDEDARVCQDIPPAACRELPRNFLLHLIASIATHVGDELANAKTVLAWLLSSVGAPAVFVGLLVPLRESGSLVPQLFVAATIRGYARRKWFWVAGSLLQGAAVAAMGLVAIMADGMTAGALIIGLLIVFSLARGISSVAYKDVLGKTVSKTRRGTLMGYSAAVAGLVTVAVGVYAQTLAAEPHQRTFFLVLLVFAGLMWFVAAAVFAGLKEAPGATEGGGNAITQALASFGLLRTDAGFRHFVVTRALLLSTALSVPFYVLLAKERTDSSIASLGLLIIASGVAGSVSAPIWGRLADTSSRMVMASAALAAAVLGLLVFVLTAWDFAWLRNPYAFAVFFLAIGIAHSGVRLGRKTYLVDLATPATRPAYVALSNTVIGVLILVGGVFGLVADLAGVRSVILLLAVLALVAFFSALKLAEVEGGGTLTDTTGTPPGRRRAS